MILTIIRVLGAMLLIGFLIFAVTSVQTKQYKIKIQKIELESNKRRLEQLNEQLKNKNNEVEQNVDKIKQLEDDRERLKSELQAKLDAKQKLTRVALNVSGEGVANAQGSKIEWMRAAGINESDWGYVDYIISKESGWNPNARNASSGAGGLPQALPYSKTGCAWGDAVCQLQWANGYAVNRYGSWAGAYNFWIGHNWW